MGHTWLGFQPMTLLSTFCLSIAFFCFATSSACAFAIDDVFEGRSFSDVDSSLHASAYWKNWSVSSGSRVGSGTFCSSFALSFGEMPSHIALQPSGQSSSWQRVNSIM